MLPPPRASATPDTVWHELDRVLDSCATLARQSQPPADFYRELLAQVATALAAEATCAWTAAGPQTLTAIAATGTITPELRSQLELLAQRNEPQVSFDATAYYIVASISPRDWLGENWAVDQRWASRRWGALGVALPGDLPPSTHRVAEQFVGEVAAIAAEYHARLQLTAASTDRDDLHQLADLARQAGASLDEREVAEIIVNEARRLLACDRVSLLRARGTHAPLVATSGLEQFDRHSRAVRDLESLATVCLRWGEAVTYNDASDDAPPELADHLASYADASDVRQLVAVPMTINSPAGQPRTLGLLIAEHFAADGVQLAGSRMLELAIAIAPAVHASQVVSAIPLARWWQAAPLLSSRPALRRMLMTGVVLGLIAVVLCIPWPFRVRATGTLLPIARSQVFAPRDGVVDSICVAHGSDVAEGDILLVIRDPQLELDRSELAGERATLTSQLAALQSTRSAVSERETSPLERYRLSAEVATVQQQLASLAERDQLLASAAAALDVRSPRSGRVLTWHVEDELARRPVMRGDALLQVADSKGGWQIELAVPDEQMGYVRAAHAAGTLVIEYQLAADDATLHRAVVEHIAEHVVETTDTLGNITATVSVVATPADVLQHDALVAAAMRPGGTLRARLVCGTRPLGYVLMHQLARRVTQWWEL